MDRGVWERDATGHAEVACWRGSVHLGPRTHPLPPPHSAALPLTPPPPELLLLPLLPPLLLLLVVAELWLHHLDLPCRLPRPEQRAAPLAASR
jgi:hypothetical protein